MRTLKTKTTTHGAAHHRRLNQKPNNKQTNYNLEITKKKQT